MKKIIFFAALFFALQTSEIFACSCASEDNNLQASVKTAFDNSKAVFSGKVIEIKRDESLPYVRVKFQIKKSWKDNLPKEIVVQTGFNSADCGYPFVVGKKYLVYADREGEELQTNICSRTSLSARNKDVAFLNQLKKRKA